jgi:hypothetical protein
MPTFENPAGGFFNEDSSPPMVVAVSSGSTIVLSKGTRDLYSNNNALLAAMTVSLPKPVPGMRVWLMSKTGITAITLHSYLGAALVPALGPVVLGAGEATILRYINAAIGWVEEKYVSAAG